MVTTVAIAIFALLTGFIAGYYIARKKSLRVQTALVISTDDKAWKEGFNDGWKHASNDFHNVKASWERLTTSDQ